MSGKRFILLLLVIVVVGFLLGFFTQGDKTSPIAGIHENRTSAERMRDGLLRDDGRVESYQFTMLTGSSRGMLFNISKALVDALGELNYKGSVRVTGGSPQSIEWLLQDRGQLTIVNSEKALQAYQGKGLFKDQKPAEDLRVMMSLWVNYWQVITLDDSPIGSLADLHDKKVAIDERYSDIHNAIRMLYAAAGIIYQEENIVYASFRESLDRLAKGEIDAVFTIAMLDGYRMSNLDSRQLNLKLIPVDDAVFQKIAASNPYYVHADFPARRIYNMPDDVTTIATIDLLLVAKSVPNEIVRQVLHDLWSNGESIQKKYPVLHTTVYDENPAYEVGLPYHPGALEFFHETNTSDDTSQL